MVQQQEREKQGKRTALTAIEMILMYLSLFSLGQETERRSSSRPRHPSSGSERDDKFIESTVFLKTRDDAGFGFRIIGGHEEGSQVSHANTDLKKFQIFKTREVYFYEPFELSPLVELLPRIKGNR